MPIRTGGRALAAAPARPPGAARPAAKGAPPSAPQPPGKRPAGPPGQRPPARTTQPAPAPTVPAAPATTAEPPRVLWRALCHAAAPVLVERAVMSDSSAWGVEHAFLPAFQRKIANEMVGWSTLLKLYSQAKTPEDRLDVARKCMTDTGLFFARAQGFGREGPGPRATAPMKLFGRMLMAGPMFYDLAAFHMGIDLPTLEALPFRPEQQRPLLDLPPETLKAVGETAVAEGLKHMSGFRLGPLALIQASALLKSPIALHAVLPHAPGNLPGQAPDEQLFDFLFWKLDHRLDELVFQASLFDEDMRSSKGAVAIRCLHMVERFKHDFAGVATTSGADLARPDSSQAARRLANMRRSLSTIHAVNFAPACVTFLHDATHNGHWDDPAAAKALRAATFLLRSGERMWRHADSGELAVTAATQARALLRSATRKSRSKALRDSIHIMA